MSVEPTRLFHPAQLFPSVTRPGDLEEIATTITQSALPFATLSQAQAHAGRVAKEISHIDKPTPEMKSALEKISNSELRVMMEGALHRQIEAEACRRGCNSGRISFIGCLED